MSKKIDPTMDNKQKQKLFESQPPETGKHDLKQQAQNEPAQQQESDDGQPDPITIKLKEETPEGCSQDVADPSEEESKVYSGYHKPQKPFDLTGIDTIEPVPFANIEDCKVLIQKSRVQTVGPLFQILYGQGIMDAQTKELKTDAALQKKGFVFQGKTFTFKVAPDAQQLAVNLLKLLDKKGVTKLQSDDQRDFNWSLSKAVSWMIEQSVDNLTTSNEQYIAKVDQERIIENGKKYLKRTVNLEKVNRLMNSNDIDFTQLVFVQSPFKLRFKHFNTKNENGKEFPLFVDCIEQDKYLQQMKWQLMIADAMENGLVCLNQHPAPLTVVSIMFSVHFGIQEIGYVERISRNKKSREVQKALRGLTRKQFKETEDVKLQKMTNE